MAETTAEQVTEAINILYSASRLTRLVAEDHERCIQAARTIQSYVVEKEPKPEPGEVVEEDN